LTSVLERNVSLFLSGIKKVAATTLPLTLSVIGYILPDRISCCMSCLLFLSAYQDKVLTLLASINEQNNTILSWIRNKDKQEAVALHRSPLTNAPCSLPAALEEDMQKLEGFLADETNFTSMVL